MKQAAARIMAGMMALAWAASVQAASITPFNPSQLQIPATGADFNSLINSINGIITPLIPNVSGSVNAISLTPAITGQPAVIGLQPGADTNAGITINPNGSGNIVLFGPGDTGALQFGNGAGWYPAKGSGVVPCPGGGAAAANSPGGILQAGMQTVAGYEVHQDWLSRSYWVPGCR